MSTENRSLFQLTADMAAIEDALYETGGELTPEIEEALHETAQSLAVKTDSYNALMRKFGSQADIIDAEIKRLTEKKKTCQKRQSQGYLYGKGTGKKSCVSFQVKLLDILADN